MWGPVILGLTQDGTSNGSLVALVDRLVAAALVIAVGIFVVLLVFPPKQGGNGRFVTGGGRDETRHTPRKAVETAARFAVLIAMLAGAWGLARLSGVLAAGLLG
jgi:hypothetical protein